MKDASEIRVGNVLRINNKILKVVSQEIKGTGKFGKMVHCKLKDLKDGRMSEKSFRAEDSVEETELTHVKMQYLYKDGENFVFMNMENYEQFTLPASAVGKQEVFLKENMEIDVEFAEGKALTVAFPKIAELKVVSAPPAVKGGGDSTYKEVELENGLKVLVPQFIKEEETIRLDVESLDYIDRVTTKTLRSGAVPKQKKEEK